MLRFVHHGKWANLFFFYYNTYLKKDIKTHTINLIGGFKLAKDGFEVSILISIVWNSKLMKPILDN